MSNFLALIVTMFTVLTRADLVVLCKLPGGEVLSMTARECLKRGGRVVKPTTTPTPRPTVTPTMSPTPSPTSAPTPTPTRTPTPTPTPSNKITISKVEVFDGTSGESTYGYVTGVKATGTNIGSEARMKVKSSGIEYSGMYQGGDGYSYILTDFLGLPHCKSFDVIVSGNNGIATASSAFSTVCP